MNDSNLRLTKVDKDYPGNKLTGAEFEVYRDSNGNQELDEEEKRLLRDVLQTVQEVK